MKKTSSFHLEEDIFNEIEKYQIENNLSSRNIALERMILEFKSLKKELEDKSLLAEFAKSVLSNESKISIEAQNKQSDIQRKQESKNDENPRNDRFRGSIKSVFENMPDVKSNDE